jgi:N-formylglutamate deformylase
VKLYNLSIPTGVRAPVVASLPHSGTYVPRKIFKRFKKDPSLILYGRDWHLEKLYDFLPELGITVIQATHSRYVVNLNRGLEEPLFGPQDTSVVAYENTLKTRLYDGELSKSEVDERIKKYYLPYYRRLTGILRRMIKDYGSVYLVDLHSFYNGSTEDVCLSNINEASCSQRFIGSFENAMKRQGFSVNSNGRWIGGYITRYFGSMDNVESLQIELRFVTYLNMETFGGKEAPELDTVKYGDVKERMRNVFIDVVNAIQD